VKVKPNLPWKQLKTQLSPACSVTQTLNITQNIPGHAEYSVLWCYLQDIVSPEHFKIVTMPNLFEKWFFQAVS
jgi:hypothetical protein